MFYILFLIYFLFISFSSYTLNLIFLYPSAFISLFLSIYLYYHSLVLFVISLFLAPLLVLHLFACCRSLSMSSKHLSCSLLFPLYPRPLIIFIFVTSFNFFYSLFYTPYLVYLYLYYFFYIFVIIL